MTNQMHFSNANGRRQTVEQASGTVDMFPSISEDLIGMDLSPDLLSGTFVRNASIQIPYGNNVPGGTHPIQWFQDSNDGPWHPKGIALPGSQNGLTIQNQGFTFTGEYRDSFSPSECDTIPMPSDSGYASYGAKQSNATGSICYDEPLENHETQSLAGQFHQTMDLQQTWRNIRRDIPSRTCAKYQDVLGQKGSARQMTLIAMHKDKLWPRADNFRAHIKRVHQQQFSDEQLEQFVYRIPSIAPQDVLPDIAGMQPSLMDYNAHEDQALHNQVPYWNDQSNITASADAPKGLTSVHQTRQNHTSQDRESDEQVIDIDADSNDHTDVHITHAQLKSMTTPTTIATDSPEYTESDEGNEQQYVIPAHLNQRGPPASMVFTSVDEHNSVPEHAACGPIPDTSDSDAEGAATPISTAEPKASPDSSDISMSSSEDVSSLISQLSSLRDQSKVLVLEALKKSGLLLEALEHEKEQKPTPSEKAPENTSRQDAQNKCPQCDKGFPRPCELKKHMKRHEKPYGCTFEGCNKRFGSKNDWKRHENSQHFMVEVWKCDVQSTNGIPQLCGKVSHRRETFRQHLISSHQVDTTIIEKKLEDCRVGRVCEENFWCGFCEKVIKNDSKSGAEAWTRRYDHIDDHIAGRHELVQKQMDDWKSFDPDAQLDASIASTELSHGGTAAPSVPNAPSGTLSAEGHPGDKRRVSHNKRKADRNSEGRHSKKPKVNGKDDELMATTTCVSIHDPASDT
ncbi:hypothetical protein G7054_g2515 [Neopestalotiopsis clavispora]|nr:hypothetical protein G7054_g2515 [Neopestalotiopsis clavispora]